MSVGVRSVGAAATTVANSKIAVKLPARYQERFIRRPDFLFRIMCASTAGSPYPSLRSVRFWTKDASWLDPGCLFLRAAGADNEANCPSASAQNARDQGPERVFLSFRFSDRRSMPRRRAAREMFPWVS